MTKKESSEKVTTEPAFADKSKLKIIHQQDDNYINIADFLPDEKYVMKFILSMRGPGKTTSIVLNAIYNHYNLLDNDNRHYMNDDKSLWIYLRRYENESEAFSVELPIIEQLFHRATGKFLKVARMPYKFKGNKIAYDSFFSFVFDEKDECDMFDPYDGEVYQPDDEDVFMIVAALTVASRRKSSALSRANLIIYDEFIDLEKRELKNETFKFLQFSQTVFRDKQDFRAIFAGNPTNLYNNYFLDFEILPSRKTTKNGIIEITMYDADDAFINSQMNTQFSKLIEKIESDGSSLHNKFDNEFNDFMLQRHKSDKNFVNFVMSNPVSGEKEFYGFWKHDNDYIVSKKHNPNIQTYAFNYRSASDDFLFSEELYERVADIFLDGHLKFEDVKTRSIFLKELRYLV
jgi:hypothetical protein